MPRPAARRTRKLPAKPAAQSRLNGGAKSTESAEVAEASNQEKPDHQSNTEQDGAEKDPTPKVNDTAGDARIENGTPVRKRAVSRAPSSAGSVIGRHVMPASANKIQRPTTNLGGGAGGGAATPSVKTFDYSIMSNFKLRPRKPSILHLDDDDVNLDLPSGLNPDDEDDDVFLDSESIDIGVPEAGDEGTPLKVGKEKERRTSLTEKDNESESKNKQTGEESAIQVPGTQQVAANDGKERSSSPLSSPPASDAEDGLPSPLKLTEENLNKLETESSRPHDDAGDVSDEQTPTRPLAIGIEALHGSMLPPASSSSIRSPLRSSEIEGSEGSEEDEQDDDTIKGDAKTTKSKRGAGSKPKQQQQRQKPIDHISTANLRERLLPQRKRRKVLRERATKRDTLDVVSDEEQEDESNNDEDELSYMATTKNTRPRQKRRKAPSKKAPNQVKNKEDAGGTNAKATGRKGRRKTYGKSRPEELEAAEQQDAEPGEVDGADNDGDDNAEQGETSEENTQSVNDELAKQKKKFEEIWKWDMEFEDVPENEQGDGEISSPFR